MTEWKRGPWKVERDEMRILAPRYCKRCGDDRHEGERCLVKNLRCNYPPCVSPDGHVTSVCRMLMMRCRLPICMDQRGHIADSHGKCPRDGTEVYGKDQAAADFFKHQFKIYRKHLTDSEVRMIKAYERGGK